jgi:hypothetical protein
MAIESTGWQPAWRPFRGAVAIALLALAVTAGCSGSSSDSGAAPKTSNRLGGPARAGKPPRRALGARPRVRLRLFSQSGPGKQAGRPVVRVPSNVDPTGRTEVTNAIQSVVGHAPNGSVIEFPKNARYRVERTLWIRNRRNLTFEGNGATIFATKRGAFDRSQIWVKRGTNIVFRELKVKGVHPNGGTSEGAYVRQLETQHGFRFEGTDGGQLDHVTVTDVYGDFVYLGRELHRTHVPCRDIWIHDSTFARNGRQGIAVTDARDVIIERNHFTAMRRSTVDLEPNAHSWKVSRVFVLNNVVGPGRLLFIASHGEGSVDDVVISGNVLRGHALTIDALPPEGERRSNWVVTNNVSNTTVNSRPMRFFSIDGLVVKNNRQLVAGGDPGVVLTDDCGAQVVQNDFGRGGVQRIGRLCSAPLRVPAVPLIAGRGGTPPTTPTTQPHRPPTTRPHRPPTTRHPTGGPTTRPPASSPGGGHTTAGWLLLAAALAILLVVAITWFARSRRGPPGR